MNFNEERLRDRAKPHLEACRSGDWEHALRVVEWVKVLGEGRQDLYLLVTAGYLHDVGWSGIAPRGKIDLDSMHKLEQKANENSPKMARQILLSLQYVDPEILTVIRLIGAADKHKSEQEDEEIVVDADNLSKLCIEHLQQKYQPESFPEVLKLWRDEFPNRIKTEKGKEVFPGLLIGLEQSINQL